MLNINSLAVYTLDNKYIEDFKQLYNVNLKEEKHSTFIKNIITDDTNICIQCNYKINCKNNDKTSFSLINIENIQSSIITKILNLIKINKQHFNIQNLFLGGIFFCSFNNKVSIELINSNLLNILNYIKNNLHIIFKNDLVYVLCDIENNIIIIYYNRKCYVNNINLIE